MTRQNKNRSARERTLSPPLFPPNKKMKFQNLDTNKLKLICGGTLGFYLGVVALVLSLSFLSILNSVPFVSPLLEVLGIYWLFQNKEEAIVRFKQITKPAFSKATEFLVLKPSEDGELNK